MALPTGTSRGSGLSRSEAAIEAWKKRARNPKAAGGLDPKIAARVKEILASKVKGKKGKAKPKGKHVDPAKAKEKAAKLAERAKAKQEREKAKAERATAATAKKQERDKAKTERLAGQQKKLAERQQKLKQAAQAKQQKAKAGAAKQGEKAKANAARQKLREKAVAERTAAGAAKQKQAQQRKTRVLSEKLKRGEKLSASDQVDAEDAGLVKKAGTKAMDFAIKQSAEERAMFASMDEHGTRKTPKGGDKGGGAAKDTRPKLRDGLSYGPDIHHTAVAVGHQLHVPGTRSSGTIRGKVTKVNRTTVEYETDYMGKPMKLKAHKHELAGGYAQHGDTVHSIKALEDTDMSELDLSFAIKAGARHSKMDASHLDEAARHLHAAGATCPDCAPEGDEDDGDAAKAIKGIMDDPTWYAQHECSDIMQASSGLQTIAMLIGSELSEEDEDDAQIKNLCDAADTLIEFIQGELSELRGAAGDAADTRGQAPSSKAVGDDDYLHTDGGAIKAMDDGTIEGLGVLYATKATHDLEKDYYDKNTDLWLDHWGWPRPITYHHGMDAGTRDDPVIGHWTKATVTDEGVWLSGQLDRAHRYYKAIKELAQRGYLKISSDSGPQWVIREPQTNGANYIKRWPLVSASLTVTPMEPRMFPVEVKAFLAELGYEAIDSPEAGSTKSARPERVEADTARARRLTVELSLMELEETAL